MIKVNKVGSVEIVEYEEFLTENIILHDRQGNRYVCLVDDEKQFHQLKFSPEEDENNIIDDYVYAYKYGYLICRIWKNGRESVSVVDSNMRTCFSTEIYSGDGIPLNLTNIVILTRQYMAVKNHIIDLKTGEHILELFLDYEKSYNLTLSMNPEKDIFILVYQMSYWNTYYIYKIDLWEKKVLEVKKRENILGTCLDGECIFKKISEKRFIFCQEEKSKKIIYNSNLKEERYIANISMEMDFIKVDEEREHICYIDENSKMMDVDCGTGEMKTLCIPGYQKKWIFLNYIDGKMYFGIGKRKIGIFDVYTGELKEINFNNKIHDIFKRKNALIILTILEAKTEYDLKTKEYILLKNGVAEYFCIEDSDN